MFDEQSLRDRLCPTTEGVREEICRLERLVAHRYYLKRLYRIIGLHRRSASSARTKYDSIAGQYRQIEAAMSDDDKALAFVDDTPCFVRRAAFRDYHRHYLARAVAETGADSLLEVGAGELNTLLPVAEALNGKLREVIALDISAARLEAGKPYDTQGLVTQYIAASASDIPLPDKAVDVILTSHCLEQSPELVEPALREFSRVAKRGIVLAEPAYELAHPLQKKRIRKIGYARGIVAAAKRLGLNVTRHELVPVREYLNGSALTVITL